MSQIKDKIEILVYKAWQQTILAVGKYGRALIKRKK